MLLGTDINIIIMSSPKSADRARDLNLLKSILSVSPSFSSLYSSSSSTVVSPQQSHIQQTSNNYSDEDGDASKYSKHSTPRSDSSGEKHHHHHQHHHHRRHRHHHHHRHKDYKFQEVEENATSKLNSKYRELRALLTAQYQSHRSALLEEQLKHSRSLMQHYLSSSGYEAPPVKWAEKHMTKKRVVIVPSPRSDCSTQTIEKVTRKEPELIPGTAYTPANKEEKKNVNEKLIEIEGDSEDLNSSCSQTSDLKRVSFQERDADTFLIDSEDEDFVLTDNIPQQEITIQVSPRSILKDTGSTQQPQKQIKKHNRKIQNVGDPNDHAKHYNKFANKKSDSSQERPKSPVLQLNKVKPVTDCKLKTTDNPHLKQWLKAKNKEWRRKKAADRLKEREKREKQQAEQEHKMARFAESEIVVNQWMKEKQVEARLLRKRERVMKKFDHNKDVFDKSTPMSKSTRSASPKHPSTPAPTPTTPKQSLSPPQTPKGNGEPQTPKGNDKKSEKEHKESETNEGLEKDRKHVEAEITEVDRYNMQQQKIAEEIKRQSRIAKEYRDNQDKFNDFSFNKNDPKKSGKNPQKAKKKKPKKEEPPKEDPLKKRISYDTWLLTKRKEELKRQKREQAKKEKDRLSKSDPEVEKIIPDLARERLKKMEEDKKRVDSGIDKVEEANRPKTPSAASGDSRPATPKYTWKPRPDVDNNSRPTSAKPESGRPPTRSERPSSARPSPASNATFGRPPAPPRSSRSPLPTRSRADNITDNHPNPFKPDSMYDNYPNPLKNPIPPSAPRGNAPNTPSYRRQQYSKSVWEKLGGERPEPQGCDRPDEMPAHDSASETSSQTGKTDVKTESKKDANSGSESSLQVGLKKGTFLTSIET